MTAKYVPDLGDLIKADFSFEQAGHEQDGWRPVIVLSRQEANKTLGLAVVATVTNQAKGYPFEVPLPPGLKIEGVVLADQIRTIDWVARKVRYFDKAPEGTLKMVLVKLGLLLGLPKP